ncbi:RNA polymerase sigma factor, partial [Singulisphaera rosea]
MASGCKRSVLPLILHAFQSGSVAGMTDGQLLQRFASLGDEVAFEALVIRHGRLILSVCRGLLHDPNDVEDAFQATLVILVRKAGSIHLHDSLGPWLYGVAYRVAVRARATAKRRNARELQAT